MDVILEVTDTFCLDHVYAALVPKRAAPHDFFDPYAPNSTLADQTFSAWQYKPATSLFSLEPSRAAYESAWTRDNIYRQAISLYFITWFFGLVVYYIFASLSYYFVFDKETKKHPKYLKNQVSLEMWQSNKSMPVMSLLTTPCFLAEVRGYSKLYDLTSEGPGTWYNYFQFPLFLVFTDFFIYLIHRGLHHPLIYKHLHKSHHKWIMPTPFASHAFHPFDGFAQSVPYHVFPFIFPLQKLAYVALFVFVNFWTILIHDGEFVSDNPVVNGAACHAIHHLAFNYNYGQYFTLWDRVGGSYRKPEEIMFKKEQRMSEKQWKKESEEMERIVGEVEGDDDRVYLPDDKKTQ